MQEIQSVRKMNKTGQDLIMKGDSEGRLAWEDAFLPSSSKPGHSQQGLDFAVLPYSVSLIDSALWLLGENPRLEPVQLQSLRQILGPCCYL